MATENREGRVKVELGLTYNLGNYESLRVSVGLEEHYVDGEPGRRRDDVFTGLLDDVRTKLYETLAAEVRNYAELRDAVLKGD